MAARRWFRRARLGLPTVIGLRPGGFFIPYRYADRVPGPGARPPYAAVEALFAARHDGFAAVLAGLAEHRDAFTKIAREAEAAADGAPVPRWDQGWFPALDAAVAYAIVRRFRPGRIVEVGSGHSTRFLARAIADGGLTTKLTAIDPAPRARIDATGAEVLHATVAEAGLAPFGALRQADILFIDSSHVLMPGSDVDLLFNHVLPRLPSGTLVHVHDIFLPDDYPPDWAWRGYNEQLALVPMLLGGAWVVVFASHYAMTRMEGLMTDGAVAELPTFPDAPAASLWLERR